MSGGVDSAVAAALLREQGCEVGGVTFRLYCYGDEAGASRACCGLEGIRDAQATARRLDIAHTILDLEDLFRARVIDDFVREYAAGRTPNPCVECNTHVKFAPLLQWGRRQGYDAIATGHYVRLERREVGGRLRPLLRAAVDPSKDQSYVLWGVPPGILQSTVFPLGGLSKPEVRARARDLGLPVWEKHESQDICFVGDEGYAAVLRRSLGEEHPVFREGEILDEDGTILGRHAGLAHYTIGQRRGIGVSGPEPLHVISLEPQRNALRVGSASSLDRLELTASGLVLHVPPEELERDEVEVKIRYRHQPARARVTVERDRLRVRFVEPQRAVAPGQSCVVYRDSFLLAGGRIDGDPEPRVEATGVPS